ncbi:hypothetical protein JCM3770_006961 [Rhodotorula araucariae]
MGNERDSQTSQYDTESARMAAMDISDDDTASSSSTTRDRVVTAHGAHGPARTDDTEVERSALPVTTVAMSQEPQVAHRSAPSGRPTAFLDMSNLQDSLSEDTSGEFSSSSSDSLELESGASTDNDLVPAATRPTPAASARAPAAFRTPVRGPRARQANQTITSPTTKTPSSALPAAIPPDFPLPHPSSEFNILNHAPARHPAPPPGWKEPQERTVEEQIKESARSDERRNRAEAGRRLREPKGTEWEWEWVREGPLGVAADRKGKGKAKEAAVDYRAASFFPYAHLPGLSYMSGVLAMAGGAKVELFQLSNASPSTTDSPLVKLIARATDVKLSPAHRDHEEYFTCAWSVNITTQPYTPMLAVSGRGRVIDVFLIAQRATGEWVLHKERTITGHGGSIHHLAFHPSYPHLLSSASEDKTIRLWDPTVPWGTDAATSARVRAAPARGMRGGLKGAARIRAEEAIRASEGGRTSRPRVEGELLGVLAEGGHEKAVMSCDFHATLPLLVSAGNDGFIKLWQLPSSVLSATPYWPHTPLYRHPPTPPPFSHAPLIHPPIFSSYAVHPGQWPDQVFFASPTTCTILSKAPVTHPDARFSPRTGVKLWVPSVLDVLPSASSSAGDRCAAVGRARLAARAQGPQAVPALLALQAPLPPYARSDSAFRVLNEAVLETQTCVGDSIGWHRPLAGADTRAEDPFFVVATATPLPVRAEAMNEEALYFFRPFAPPPFAPTPASPTPAASSAIRPGGSSSAGISATPARASAATARAAELDAAVDALFPPGRDRAAHDFTPRLLPSAVADVFPPSSTGAGAGRGWRNRERERERVHWRAVAVSPGGGDVVAAGDEGAVAVFRRRRRAEHDVGGDEMRE